MNLRDVSKAWPKILGLLALACSSPSGPQTADSHTNWLKSCQVDEQCGKLSCLCGVCTNPCADASACSELQGTSCVAPSEPGAIAQCDGNRPAALGLCLPRCDDASCGAGEMCVAGVCTPLPEPTSTVSIDTSVVHQSLTGFGASVAYVEDEITSHPRKAALYQAAFADLGLDVLRLRNRYAEAGDDDLTTAAELVTASTASLGHAPTLFMTSWSPPATLKASGATVCAGNAETCTLSRTTGGAFNYAGLGAHVRASLEAYANIGVFPQYFGVQNNPDWLPTSAESGEACRFLPTQGTTSVVVKGVNVNVEYPGLAEAQAAIVSALSGFTSIPQFLAPETSDFAHVKEYVTALSGTRLDALAHHLYGTDPRAVDTAGLAAVGELAQKLGKPVFQTEMHSDGLGTALLLHYATVLEGASAYLQATLTGSSSGPAASPDALIGLDATTFVLQDPYHAMRHFARYTDPGWKRIDAASDSDNLLASGWISPSGNALTLILINPSTESISTKLALPAALKSASSEVTRSAFAGVERSVSLGKLSPEGVLNLPSRSVVTVALSQ